MLNSVLVRVQWFLALLPLFASSSLLAVDVPAVFSDHGDLTSQFAVSLERLDLLSVVIDELG